jgi:hypothetical protein
MLERMADRRSFYHVPRRCPAGIQTEKRSRTVRLARSKVYAAKTIVAILPDSGERYISTVLFEGIG